MSDATPKQPQPSASNPATPQGGGTSSRASKPRWFRRGWVIAIASLLLGVTLASAGAASADPKESAEYQALSQNLREIRGQLQAAKSDLSSTKAELSSTKAELSSTKAELKQVIGDLPAREEALKTAQADLDDRAAALDDRKAALDDRKAALKAAEKAVANREKKVGLVEKEIANNTIPGEGIYEVGVDMKAGTYKTSGSTDCYYAVNGDANGNNIKSNNITSGPAVVSVSEGEFFEASGCADFILQN